MTSISQDRLFSVAAIVQDRSGCTLEYALHLTKAFVKSYQRLPILDRDLASRICIKFTEIGRLPQESV